MEFIQGNKFKELAEITYSPRNKILPDDYDRLPNTFDPSNLKECNLIYTHTMYVKTLFDIIQHIGKKFIVITHSCDCSIEDDGIMRPDGHGNVAYNESFTIPDNVIRWYSKNVNTLNPKVESIPIGLENAWWAERNGDKIGLLGDQLKKLRKIKNLMYMNHKISTNSVKRNGLYEMLQDKSWVTAKRGANGVNFNGYIDNIYNHKFVISPEGNGIDTHRTWECLYMGTIPIEKRNINNQFYTDLPICFVDDWKEVTEDFLEKEYDRIKQSAWNMEKLDFGYWKNKIKGLSDFMNYMYGKELNGSGWATHQMVLLDTLKRINKPVLELGSGNNSTIQIHNALKNKNIRILTIEQDQKWLNKFTHLKSDLHDFKCIDDSNIQKFCDTDNENWGLAFIDCPTWDARKIALQKYSNVAEYVILHDCDAIVIGDDTFGKESKRIDPVNHDPGIRDYSKTFKYWIEFFVDGWRRQHPPVLLASNKICLDNIKGVQGMIISQRNK